MRGLAAIGLMIALGGCAAMHVPVPHFTKSSSWTVDEYNRDAQICNARLVPAQPGAPSPDVSEEAANALLIGCMTEKGWQHTGTY